MLLIVKNLILLIRPYQWIKNLIIFVPLVSSQKYEINSLILCFKALIIFSLISSCGYIINDLFDEKYDKIHPTKKYRPLAAGNLNKEICIIFSIIIFFVAIYLGINESFEFISIVVIYFILSFFYSYFLKKIIIIDLIVISFLFLFRILAGSEIINVETSIYLLLFSQLFFLSLAGIKRLAETKLFDEIENNKLPGRPYSKNNYKIISIISFLTFALSLLVLIIYISSSNANDIYSKVFILYSMCPIIALWFLRMYIKANNNKITGDPIIFAIKDKVSILMLVISAVVIISSI